MTATAEQTIWCDAPSCWIWTTGRGNVPTVKELRTEAKSDGWAVNVQIVNPYDPTAPGPRGDYCPDHATDYR